jgi:hypothetical protein
MAKIDYNSIGFKNEFIDKANDGRFGKKNIDDNGGLITRNRAKTAREIRKDVTPMRNEDGSHSTHVMASGESGDKKHPYAVHPTIFPNDKGKSWKNLSENPNEAYDEAKKRGEVFGFKSAKKAEKFSYGIPWKQGEDKKEAKENYRQSKKEGTLYTQSESFKVDKQRIKNSK